ncbi:MAG: diguanylate cyclase [bacterium]|nr:diguanylate cyclase [bacterium]MDD5353888.1 diguanylate cyclase [bacterium]MDD5756996.1 diguanylate cyclase [bacterium]
MAFNTIPYLIIGSSLFFLGSFILVKNIRARVNILLGLTCIASTLWLICFALANYFAGRELIMFLLRLGYVGFIFIPILLYHYTVIFLNIKSRGQSLTIPYIGGLVFAMNAMLNPLFFSGYRQFFWGYTPIGGIVHGVFAVFYLVLYARINYILYKHYREAKRTSSLKYSQIRYLFCTVGILPLSAIDFLGIKGIEFYPSGYLFTMLGLVLVVITVLRYRLVEIDIIINKLIFLFVNSMLVALCYVLLTNALLPIFSPSLAGLLAVAIIITVMFFTSMKDKLQQVIDVIVYRNKYEYQKALKETTQLLITKLDLNELCYFLIQMLAKNIGMLKASLLLENNEGNYDIRAGYALEKGLMSQYSIRQDAPLIAWLKENRSILIKEEAEQYLSKQNLKEIFGDLRRISAEVVIPLFYRGNLTGLVCLDNKQSGAIYNQADIDILEALAGQAAIALEKAKLYTEAVTDSQTQLYYHRYFQRRMAEEMDRARRYSHYLSLVLIDIDNMNKLNDVYGHKEGDRIITEVAALIKNSIRLTDVAARFSGQEFVLILPETREEGAYNVAHRIKENVSRVVEIAEHIRREVEKQKINVAGGGKLEITVSVGVSNFNGLDGHMTAETIIEMTKKALVKAKNMGGNRVVIHTPEPAESRTT